MRSSLADYVDVKHDRKTWYKCFEDIGMIYGILIELDEKRKGYYYHILNPEVLRGRDVERWMLACVAHRNLLEECMGMYNRIDIEGFPSENGMLMPIVHAMKDSHKMEVIYQKYGKEPKKHIVEPHCIKTYNHRFYVLCKYDTGQFYTLSFDRILEARELKEHFNFPNDLFASDYFEDAFGVMIPPGDVEPVDIVVRAKGDMRYYYEDVPIHKSQKIVRKEKDFTDFMVHIRPTDDFIGTVMHQGARLEIMSPDDVRCHVKEELEKTLHPYQTS